MGTENKRLIQVQGLTAGYGSRIVLERISFEVMRGEIFVILGPSGCGKSTLLRHLIGLAHPSAGNILVDGEDITASTDAQQRFLKRIGVLFQGSALLGSMTLADNIALPVREFTSLPQPAVDLLVRMKLATVNLEGFENHLPSEISGGMKKRAGLARALALNPDILFLDEPTSGLDPITSAEIDELILDINRRLGTTMVIVTHELASIFNIAGRVIMLDKSRKGIVAAGDPFHLKEHSPNPTVRRFFNRLGPSAVFTGQENG